MNILIAPDSFKESMSAIDVANHIKVGWQKAIPGSHVVCQPMADGGEGTLDVLLEAMQGEKMRADVQDAIGRPIKANWGWVASSQLAIIEFAQAAGLEHIAPEDRDIIHASSYGVGELILAALDKGAKELLVTVGGSATNDGGFGMLAALGVEFTDRYGHMIKPGGLALQKIARISTENLDVRAKNAVWKVACDVKNPLCGEFGAAAVFGPQKGASASQVILLDRALSHYATVCHDQLGYELRDVAGGGAAGGVAAAMYAFFNAELVPGADLVMHYCGFHDALQRADVVITGEGRIDSQSAQGKVPWTVASAAQALGIPVIVVCGTIGSGYEAFYEKENIVSVTSIIDAPMNLKKALRDCGALLENSMYSIARCWAWGYKKTAS